MRDSNFLSTPTLKLSGKSRDFAINNSVLTRPSMIMMRKGENGLLVIGPLPCSQFACCLVSLEKLLENGASWFFTIGPLCLF